MARGGSDGLSKEEKNKDRNYGHSLRHNCRGIIYSSRETWLSAKWREGG